MLKEACELGAHAFLELLFEVRGGDSCVMDHLNQVHEKSGMTLLMEAVQGRDEKLLQVLLSHSKIDLKCKCEKSQTYGAEYAGFDVVKLAKTLNAKEIVKLIESKKK